MKKFLIPALIIMAICTLAFRPPIVNSITEIYNKVKELSTDAIKTTGVHGSHSGNSYYVCGETTLASGDSVDFQLTTQNTTEWIHMTFEYQGTQELLLEIFETSTVSADGSAITPYNNDRNSSNTSNLALIQSGGTVSVPGTIIYSQKSGVAGNPNRARSAFGKRDKGLIMKQNITYRFVFTSGGNDNNFSYCGDWDEYTNKN